MKLNVLKSLLGLAGGVVLAGSASAQFAGIFGYGIELEATGAGATDPGRTLYALNASGGDRLLPTGSSATLDQTSWLTSPETTGGGPTFDLGTFNPDAGDTLILQGFSMLTFRDEAAGSVITSAFGNHRVTAVGQPFQDFAPGTPLALQELALGGNANDDRWVAESLGIDLLDGLSPGTYILGTFGFASSFNPDAAHFANNSDEDFGNFGATFTVLDGSVLTGDLNGDGFVGAGDLDILLGIWNQNVSGELADLNADDFIGAGDLDILLGNWNAGTPPTSVSAVPEPASLALLGLSSLTLVRRR